LTNIRKDAAHKLTTDLTRRFETIVIEDLNVSGIPQNHSLAGAVLDCGFHEIRRQFQYKAAMRDGRIVIADRFYPSTQICSCCGCLTGPKGREGLSVEQWVCSECGAEHERDANAAINLRKLGLAKPRINARGREASTGCVSIPASVVDEPRTETVLTIVESKFGTLEKQQPGAVGARVSAASGKTTSRLSRLLPGRLTRLRGRFRSGSEDSLQVVQTCGTAANAEGQSSSRPRKAKGGRNLL
jgi:hypothetical protein